MVTTRSMTRAAAAPAAAPADIRPPEWPPNLANGPPDFRFKDIREIADMMSGRLKRESRARSAEAERIRQSLIGAQCDELVPTGQNTYRPCKTGPQSRDILVKFCDQQRPPPEDHDLQGHKVCDECHLRILDEQDDNIASKFPISVHVCKTCTEVYCEDPLENPPGENLCNCRDYIRDQGWKCKACYVRLIDRLAEAANRQVQDLLFTHREKFWHSGQVQYRVVKKKTARKWPACGEESCGKRSWTTRLQNPNRTVIHPRAASMCMACSMPYVPA